MPEITNLSTTKECLYSGLIMAFCSHCRGDDDVATLTNDPTEDYEATAVFLSQYSGTCTINRDHRIRRGDRVAKVQYADNPTRIIPGVCCSDCLRDIPRAK